MGLTARVMATWRNRVLFLRDDLIWAFLSEDEARRRERICRWILSYEPRASESEAYQRDLVDFICSLRSRALSSVCAQFIALRENETAAQASIYRAAQKFEHEFSAFMGA